MTQELPEHLPGIVIPCQEHWTQHEIQQVKLQIQLYEGTYDAMREAKEAAVGNFNMQSNMLANALLEIAALKQSVTELTVQLSDAVTRWQLEKSERIAQSQRAEQAKARVKELERQRDEYDKASNGFRGGYESNAGQG